MTDSKPPENCLVTVALHNNNDQGKRDISKLCQILYNSALLNYGL